MQDCPFLIQEKNMNVNLDFCGVPELLRQLVDADICLASEAIRIAERIARQTGAGIIFSTDFRKKL